MLFSPLADNGLPCQVGQPLPQYWRKFTSGVLRSGSRKDVEINVGQQIISVTLSPVAGKDYVNLYGLDITERKKAEEQLRESQKFSNSLLESSPTPTSVINLDTSIRHVNPAFEELTGYSAAELIGTKAPFPYWPKETTQENIQSFRKLCAMGIRR